MLKPANCSVAVLGIFPHIFKIVLIQGFSQDEKKRNVKMASDLMVSLGRGTCKYRNTNTHSTNIQKYKHKTSHDSRAALVLTPPLT